MQNLISSYREEDVDNEAATNASVFSAGLANTRSSDLSIFRISMPARCGGSGPVSRSPMGQRTREAGGQLGIYRDRGKVNRAVVRVEQQAIVSYIERIKYLLFWKKK